LWAKNAVRNLNVFNFAHPSSHLGELKSGITQLVGLSHPSMGSDCQLDFILVFIIEIFFPLFLQSDSQGLVIRHADLNISSHKQKIAF
jgi:hypothetical protein